MRGAFLVDQALCLRANRCPRDRRRPPRDNRRHPGLDPGSIVTAVILLKSKPEIFGWSAIGIKSCVPLISLNFIILKIYSFTCRAYDAPRIAPVYGKIE